MRRILLLLLSLSLASHGWGEAGSKNTPAFPLGGVWGGYFPGSSLQDPREGVEVRFDRQSRNGLIFRVPLAKPPKRPCSANPAVDRSTVIVHQTGKHVTVTFPGATGDESTFRGTFVNADRIQGKFTNSCRGENFKMDLVSADSAGETPDPADRSHGRERQDVYDPLRPGLSLQPGNVDDGGRDLGPGILGPQRDFGGAASIVLPGLDRLQPVSRGRRVRLASRSGLVRSTTDRIREGHPEQPS